MSTVDYVDCHRPFPSTLWRNENVYKGQGECGFRVPWKACWGKKVGVDGFHLRSSNPDIYGLHTHTKPRSQTRPHNTTPPWNDHNALSRHELGVIRFSVRLSPPTPKQNAPFHIIKEIWIYISRNDQNAPVAPRWLVMNLGEGVNHEKALWCIIEQIRVR